MNPIWLTAASMPSARDQQQKPQGAEYREELSRCEHLPHHPAPGEQNRQDQGRGLPLHGERKKADPCNQQQGKESVGRHHCLGQPLPGVTSQQQGGGDIKDRGDENRPNNATVVAPWRSASARRARSRPVKATITDRRAAPTASQIRWENAQYFHQQPNSVLAPEKAPPEAAPGSPRCAPAAPAARRCGRACSRARRASGNSTDPGANAADGGLWRGADWRTWFLRWRSKRLHTRAKRNPMLGSWPIVTAQGLPRIQVTNGQELGTPATARKLWPCDANPSRKHLPIRHEHPEGMSTDPLSARPSGRRRRAARRPDLDQRARPR